MMNQQQGPVRKKRNIVKAAQDLGTEDGTKQRLLNAAERLIADEGTGHVSMRRINAEAGARNLSAVHYHFGSMEAVIRGVIDMRMPQINQRRLEMLAELTPEQRQNLAQVVNTVVWPLAEQLLSSTPANFYVRFLDAFNQAPNYDTWSAIARKHRRGLTQAYMLIRRALPDIPADVLHVRIMLASREMVLKGFLLALQRDLDPDVFQSVRYLPEKLVYGLKSVGQYFVNSVLDRA